MVSVGFTLQPETAFLDLVEDLAVRHADYFEVAPETLWYFDHHGKLAANSFYHRLLALGRRVDRPFVAHGVGWSVGGVDEPAARRVLWRDGIARSHADFAFQWYTDHLGATVVGGEELILPLPLPMTDDMADRVCARLHDLQTLVPTVGVENSVFYYLLGEPLREPAFLQRCIAAPGMHLLLDLHNLYTMALNHGFDACAWLDRAPLDAVIEIHVSGGSMSEPAWLGGEVMRLDSHDHAVPEPVFALLAEVLPRCRNLRGVTLERMEGTVGADDLPVLERELLRIRELIR